MSRMNYGKRFGSGTVSARYEYSEDIDRGMRSPFQFIERAPIQNKMAQAKGAAARKAARAKITLANQPKKEPGMSEREAAERLLIERMREALELIDFSLSELTHIPNPNSRYSNLVNQQALLGAMSALAHCVKPPLKFGVPDKVLKSRLAHTYVDDDQ